MENKQEILDKLLPALQTTDNLHDLKDLWINEWNGKERVYAKFSNDIVKIVNITGDSGTSMIQDVIRQIV